MTLTDRTQVLLRRAALAEMPATYRSLVLAMARTEGLESGDAEHEQMQPAFRAMLAHRDDDDFVVTPRDSLLEREPIECALEAMARRIASRA